MSSASALLVVHRGSATHIEPVHQNQRIKKPKKTTQKSEIQRLLAAPPPPNKLKHDRGNKQDFFEDKTKPLQQKLCSTHFSTRKKGALFS